MSIPAARLRPRTCWSNWNDPSGLTALCLLLPVTARAQDPTIDVPASDPAMNRAYSDAVATLPLFLDRSGAVTGIAGNAFSIKIGVPVDHPAMDNEIIWVRSFRMNLNGKAEGVLDNEPVASDWR